MVVFMLFMKADLENIASLQLKKDENLRLSVKNPLSDFETREKIIVNPTEFVEQAENAREQDHNFALTWEGSKKRSTLTVLTAEQIKTLLKKKKGAVLPKEAYSAEDSGNFVPILAVECRGLEPFAFFPMGQEFTATSEGGYEFDTEAVDFSEGDWADYDADNDLAVSVSNIEFKWDSV
jgi:hypothetical protein